VQMNGGTYKMGEKISVIMPVYKVEDYVGKAIETIQAQSYQNWELFAVDDGSPDNSGKICDEYAAKDPRIKVIHKENGGAPSARNIAIDQATGDYFYFMDSDDWAEPDMLKDMLELALDNKAQLVVAGYYIDTYYSDTEKFTQEQVVPSAVYRDQQDFRENAYKLFDQNLLYTPWNKLYDAKYIRENKLYFPSTLWDDFPFNLSVVKDIEKVVVTDKKYYHFIRKRAESETAKYQTTMYEKREEEHGWMLGLYKYWNVDSEPSMEFVSRRYVERVIGCVENITNKNCELSGKEKRAEIKKMISKDTVRQALRLAKPRSTYMKMMLLPVKWNCAFLTYVEGLVISRVKSGHTKTYAKLKAGR